MSLRTRIPFEVLESYDWDRLRTYDEVLGELSGQEKPVEGVQGLISQSQKFGG